MQPKPLSPGTTASTHRQLQCRLPGCSSASSQQQTAPRPGVANGPICRACSMSAHTSTPVLRVLPHRVVGNCVAGRNHRYFAGFLIAGQLGCLFCLAGAIWRLRQKGLPTCVLLGGEIEGLRAACPSRDRPHHCCLWSASLTEVRNHLISGCEMLLVASCRVTAFVRARAGLAHGWVLRASC